MRKWIVRILIIVMVVVAVAGTIVAAAQKEDTPDEGLSTSSLFV